MLRFEKNYKTVIFLMYTSRSLFILSFFFFYYRYVNTIMYFNSLSFFQFTHLQSNGIVYLILQLLISFRFGGKIQTICTTPPNLK